MESQSALRLTFIMLTMFRCSHSDCTLPTSLHNGVWTYTHQSSSRSETLTFGTSTMSGLTFTAQGDTLDAYTCISNTTNVYVFRSDDSFTVLSDDRYLFLCMKITMVSKNLFYFYLLADDNKDVNPNDRVYSPETTPSNTDPTCSYCGFTTAPPNDDIRTLQRSGTTENLPGGETLCLPCENVACDVKPKGAANNVNGDSSEESDGDDNQEESDDDDSS